MKVYEAWADASQAYLDESDNSQGKHSDGGGCDACDRLRPLKGAYEDAERQALELRRRERAELEGQMIPNPEDINAAVSACLKDLGLATKHPVPTGTMGEAFIKTSRGLMTGQGKNWDSWLPRPGDMNFYRGSTVWDLRTNTMRFIPRDDGSRPLGRLE